MASILVTNDDGIHSDGLHHLARALEPVGDVTVVAPDREKSAASHALTLHRPVALRRVRKGVYMVDGTPSDCVYLGALSLLPERPDLVVSGINRGANIGDDVTYSGTIAAAFEGTILGIPSFAVSQVGFDRFDWDVAGRVARSVAARIIEESLPADILLNVNVPAGEVKGVRCTRQGKHIYDQVVHETTDPRGRKYYWVGSGESTHVEQPEDTDYTAVKQGYVSITPLHLDLTHRPALRELRDSWEPQLDRELHDELESERREPSDD